ncbi:Gfo/Idh/MocA family protein [Microterricola pindariensis]|uniref:Oxidoreductase n=1 Tax=Microterricola pindariensis TaxID=478010 RepID=A0ABX5AXM7_9MICO|nr:Gfo/Idh/MocA family oxidoreductase [Microterricola pindariensis]PPL19406.1 oxidoreductase [Microterricola pindariensis]
MNTTTTSLRWGILATGGIAHAVTSDLVANGITVQAVGSRRAESAAQFAAEFGIPNVHASYEDLVADPDVDVIYIATPHPFHAEHATMALNAGKHVLVEKPFALNAEEAREVVALAEAQGLVVLEAMWTRFLPHMQRIREILDAGTIGEVRTLIADHTQKLSDDPAHRLNALELGGGALLDLGIYPISFASSLFGQPESIQATASFRSTGADAQVATTFRYASGAIATTLSASDVQGPNRASVIGTKGRIDIDGVWYTQTGFQVLDAAGAVIEEYTTEQNGGGKHYQAVALEELVARGELNDPRLPLSEIVQIMETLDAVRAEIGLVYPGE